MHVRSVSWLAVVLLLFLWPLSLGAQPCVEGTAAGFPCNRVDLLAFVPLAALGAGTSHANDLWGWTDGASGREFVLLGLESGTAFVEITNPTAPLYLGTLPTHTAPSLWRDIKVYRHHAYIVSEASGHGVQIFDLGALLTVTAPPVTFSAVAHYDAESLSNAHNVAVNEESKFIYVLGSNTCRGGLHMVNVEKPRQPVFAGCFSGDGYTHDAQCVSYEGPDGDYRGREVCFAFNEDTLTIVDVTDKKAPRMISRTSYPGVGYTHQGWVTEDQMFLLLGDELDEEDFGHTTRTRIFDLANLDRPILIGAYDAPTPAIDHNLYVRGAHVYQANYRAGLRLYGLDAVAEGRLSPAGFFDVYPADNRAEFNGAWSVFPFFPSGVVAVSGIEQGLFLLIPCSTTRLAERLREDVRSRGKGQPLKAPHKSRSRELDERTATEAQSHGEKDKS